MADDILLPSSLEGPDGWIYIPVPERLAASAMSAVAGLIERSDSGAVSVDHDPAQTSGRGSAATMVGDENGVWPKDGYAALRAARTVSASRAILLGDALASHRGRLSMRQLVRETGLTATQIRQSLMKLTIFVQARPELFGSTVVWPFGWAYGREISNEDPREFHYSMTDEQRDAWLSAA